MDRTSQRDPRRRLRRASVVIAITTATLAATACSTITDEELAERYLADDITDGDGDLQRLPDPSGSAAPGPRVTTVECPFDTTALTDVTCGQVDLPGRGVDDDFEVTLTFARFYAQGPPSRLRPDPVVYLHGGPGGQILWEADLWYDTVVAPHVDRRDVVLYDQRGAGASSPLATCHEVGEVADAFYASRRTHAELEDEFLVAMAECARKFTERTEADLTAFDSIIHAADLADLMAALEIDTYNIHGSSYGTRLAQTVMREHPEGVRTLVLSGVYPIDANLTGSVPVSFESSLDAVFAACAAEPRCDEALPDPWATLEALVRELDRAPLEVTVPDTVTSEYGLVVDGTDFLAALHQLLYSGIDAATVPDLLIDHLDGDSRRLERLMRTGWFNLADVAAFVSVQCGEEAPFTTDADLARPVEHEFLNRVDDAPSLTGPALLPICDQWGAGPADPIRNEPVTWAAPTLLLAGALDPITPPEWAEALASRLPDRRLVVFNDLAHDSDDGLCALEIIGAFVERPEAPVDTSCAAWTEHVPIDNTARRFVSPTEPPATTIDLDLAGEADGTPAWRPVVVPDWFAEYRDDGVVLWRILDAFDPTALVITRGDAAFDHDLQAYLDVTGRPEFRLAARAGDPPGWERAVAVTTGADIVRYRHAEAGIQVALVVENGEEDALERAVVIPAIESMGVG